jgi:hypothetical protein
MNTTLKTTNQNKTKAKECINPRSFRINPKEKIHPNKKHTSNISQRGKEKEPRKGREGKEKKEPVEYDQW